MSDPRIEEFSYFHELLTEHAPDGYEPWYFRVRSGSKAPATSYGSWKDESARLSPDAAIEWMEEGGNVGIAGTPDDALVNVDIDDEDETSPDDLKATLIARSRSRVGSHAWYFEAPDAEIPNIPTDDAGEVRANWQYVVAPGSYVETDPDDVPESEREDAGYYTVERDDPVTSIRKGELPQVFLDHLEQTAQEDTDAELDEDLPDPPDRSGAGSKSALFDITAEDVVRKEGGTTDTDDRWSALFHGSDTDANMSLSSQGLIQCWRHNVSHNGLQALTVLSDYPAGCEQVGTPHTSSNAGQSCIKNEDGAHIWHAWKYAKQSGYIPDDDPVPYSALRHLCRDRELCPVSDIPESYDDGSLPGHAYDAAIRTIETHNDLNPGRKPTDELPDSEAPEAQSKASDIEEEMDDTDDPWEYVRRLYNDPDTQRLGRLRATDALEDETAWMFVLESEQLWRYDPRRGYFVQGGEAYSQARLEAELGAHYSVSEKNEIIDRLQARGQTHRSELNAKTADDPLLCVGNCVVNLRTGEPLEHSPEYKFTRGIEHDLPEDGGDPEPVVEFLDDVTKREADRDTLIDHLAHGLMPGHPYRAFVITYGPGGNGKTQLGELFRGFVGEDNAAAVELQDLTGDDEFATGALPTAFINIGDDVSVSEIRNTSVLKTATGGGTLRANEKYEKKFDFTNEAAMFFSANEPPRITEDKASIDDRLYPIEMPFRFVDDPGPENPRERKKVPGISDDLLDNGEAMEGLLALAVEHAQDLIESDGKYSMPEPPSVRREIYEAASDPIRRFALEFFEEGSAGDVILKDDAYTVYTALCHRDDERPAHEDTFKSQISQQSIVDVESGRTRKFGADDDQFTCWKYVRFDTDAKEIMPPRLIGRYFPDDEGEQKRLSEASGEAGDEVSVFGAEPITDAAEALTGYVTVTAEIATTRQLGDEETGRKAVLKDESGAIDLVAWDHNVSSRLKNLEGECIALRNAEVGEYEDTRQLSVVDGLTEIAEIQQGVGYTNPADLEEEASSEHTESETDEDRVQSGLEETPQGERTTDGGEYAGVEPKVLETLRTKGDMPLGRLVGAVGEPPDDVRAAVDRLATKGRVIVDGDGDETEVQL